MHIAVLGGTGRVGKEFIRLALEDGHRISALVRSPHKVEPYVSLSVIPGNALQRKAIAQTIHQADVVFCSLSTDKSTVLSEAIPLLIEQMEALGKKRIVTIGTAGILDSRLEHGKLRYQSAESKRKLTFAAEEHEKAYRALAASSLHWTIVCPTYLPDGQATSNIRVEVDHLPLYGERVTVGDTALFAYHVLLKENYVQKRVGIAE